MSDPLPALRHDLDVMPSPVPDRPGLLIRDPMGYAEGMLIVPPPLVPLLVLFDGRHGAAEAKAALVQATGDDAAAGLVEALRAPLSAGFLDDAELVARRAARRAAFAEATVREASHAGGAYPAEPGELERALAGWMAEAPVPHAAAEGVVGIAAPHVSPEGGAGSYASAYAALPEQAADRTFVVLGTSHYGPPERFGLTRKPFRTPLGETAVDAARLDALAHRAGEAAVMEDYCHAVEHSIELQLIFLQQRYGAGVRVLPVLCGPFARATRSGWPEDDPGVGRFLDALAELAHEGGDALVWVLGVDMAHVGRRYGDSRAARALEGELVEVERRDRERLAEIIAGDARGFWALLREGGDDDLRWCGASPLYSFLAAAGPLRGELRRYEQWNIDEASVVSFAGIVFSRPGGGHREVSP